jgi:polyphenol oxidase
VNPDFRLRPDGIYRCEAFNQFDWLEHGFGTRAANPSARVTLRQIHSDRVLNAAGLGDREREGDALISDEIGTSIGVRTADCVPILLLDPVHRAVAAVHAGWRGTAAGIVARAVERMGADFHTQAADLYAAFGPCIRACCYEVGPEVAAHFEGSGVVQHSSDGKYRLDLGQANRQQLEAAGLNPEHVFDSGFCTACLPAQFFSYRREPENPGRMLASIGRLA